MNKYNFWLSFFLFLSGVSDFHESLSTMADHEQSGDGILSTGVPEVGFTVLFSTSANKSEEQNATTTIKTEDDVMEGTQTTEMNENEPILHPAVIIGVSIVLILVLLIILVIFIVRCRKQKQSQEDELGSENVKSPIFEEDTPSVMEIEMEELDKWMNSLKKNAESDYLPPVKEEKDGNTNPSRCEVSPLPLDYDIL
ncbi:transmembrane protein 154 [Thamnophis elegans]|uniref:transmembrane protein 154 n=1 Tax=Thamnophis elegans TaxID=35005 RepID=UPI001376BFBC|nr:transmembrane protein 154 [Thamnophis elegans]